MIGLTTNWELGYWCGRDINKVVYGRPDDAYRTSYCDIMWNTINPGKPIFNTLEDTIKASIQLAEKEQGINRNIFFDKNGA